MKTIQSSLVRALCAVITGVLLIKYREETVTWLTIAIGVLFFLSGVISCAAYYSARRHRDEPQVFDAQGRQLTGAHPVFPVVGIGSLLLGVILVFMPATFITWLMYILAALLILGAVNQFVNLAAATKYVRVGLFWWLLPSLLLLVGIVAIVRPQTIASAPLFVIGWAMLLYGVAECVNTLKLHSAHRSRKAMEQAAADQAPEAAQQTPETAESAPLPEPQETADPTASNPS